MPSMNVVFTQILVIVLYLLVGFVTGKCGLVSPAQRKYLARLCTNLILPFTILSAANQSVTGRQLAGLGLAAAVMLGIFALTTFVALRVQSMRGASLPVKVTTASLVTYPNCTFLGLPLCRALFGDTAILYNAVLMVAFNVLFFTWQVSLFTGEKFRFRNLVTPPSIATALLILMLALGIRFPDPVQTVVSNTGAMISPLSLIIIGVMLSESPIVDVLRERRAYWIALFRNLLIPLLGMLLLGLMPFEPAGKVCLLVYLACPCATMTSIYAIQSDMEPELAVRGVLLSTLLFAATLPAIIWVGAAFLG